MLRRLLIPDPGTLCALAVGIPAAFSRLISYDLFFNIPSGRWILASGFPDRDPFSVTAGGPWFPHEWGYGVLAALSADFLGGRGPAILTALVLAAGVLVLWKAIRYAYGRSGLVPVVLVLLALAAQAFSWQAQRAYQLGNLLFVVTLWLVIRHRNRPDRLIGLSVLLVILWANLHGSWAAGPALLGATALGMLLDRRRSDRATLLLGGAAGLAVPAAALSPAGFGTCLYPLGFLAGGRGQGIWEWHSMDLSWGLEKTVLVLAVVFLVVWLRTKKRKLALLVPACGLVAAAVAAERFVPMAAAFLAVACADLLGGRSFFGRHPLWSALGRLDGWLISLDPRSGGAAWVLVFLAGAFVWATARPVSLTGNMHPGFFPVRSLRELATRPPGRVLNRYRFGGAVSAVAGPGHKVFIDGRNDLFPASIHRQYRRLVLLKPGWRRILEDYRPDYVLWSDLNRGEGLIRELKQDDRFKLVEEDPAGVLFVRKPTAEEPAR